MAKRRRRRISLGMAPASHRVEASKKLHDLGLLLHDLHFASGPLSCETITKQLASANALLGGINAHVHSIPTSTAPNLETALEKFRREVHRAEDKFIRSCLR